MAFKHSILLSDLKAQGYEKWWIMERYVQDVEYLNEEGLFQIEEYHYVHWFTGKKKEVNGQVTYEVGKMPDDHLYLLEKKDPRFTKLYCKCGYEGEVNFLEEKKEKDKYYPVYNCPSCGEEPKRVYPAVMHHPVTEIEYMDILDKRGDEGGKPTLSLSWARTQYYFNLGTEKLAAKNEQFRIICNIETGISYLYTPSRKNKIRIITYGRSERNFFAKECSQMTRAMNKEHSERMKTYMEMLFKAKKIQYIQVEQLQSDENCTLFDVIKALPYMRFPQLECLHAHDWTHMPEKVRKNLKQCAGSAKEIYQAILGTSSKKIRKLGETEQHGLSQLFFWSQVVKKPDNLLRITQAFFEEEAEEEKSLFFNDFVSKTRIEAIQFIRSLYQDETVFVRSIISFSEENVGYSWNWTLREFSSYIKDIFHMEKELTERIKGYSLPYRNDLGLFHDQLVKDYNRLEESCQDIPYRKKEVDQYEQEIQGVQIVLAKTTDELVKVGTEMDICVGSYRREAVKRETTILFLKDGTETTAVCLELKGKKLIQAKGKRNQIPSYQYGQLISQWCEKTGINGQNCRDLQASLSQITQQIHLPV